MLSIELSSFNKIRIWFNPNNEVFFNKYDKTFSYDFEIKGKNFEFCRNRTIIAEFFMGMGGRMVYGCLGANYIFKEDKKLYVKINTNNNKNELFKNCLFNNRSEEVFVGLLEEFQESVYMGLIK